MSNFNKHDLNYNFLIWIKAAKHGLPTTCHFDIENKTTFSSTGLHQPHPGSIWIWHNLEHVGYTNWEPGFPVDTKWNRVRGYDLEEQTLQSSKRRAKGPTVTPRGVDLESLFRVQNDLYTQPRVTPYGQLLRVPRQMPLGGQFPGANGNFKGPRACVITNTALFWQNRPCNRPIRSGYVCMRNPEV